MRMCCKQGARHEAQMSRSSDQPLRGLQSEDLTVEANLPGHIALRQPPQLPFPNHMNDLVTLDCSPGSVVGPKTLLGVDSPFHGSVASRYAAKVPVSGTLVRLAKKFIRQYPEFFGVNVADLQVAPGGTGEYGGYLWYVMFNRTYQGIPVENSYAIFRVNHGNLVQFGGEFMGPISVDTLPTPYTEASIAGRYTLQLPYLDLVGRTAPLFLVNGNHEQAALPKQ